MSIPDNGLPNIIVVGGGGAGASVANYLSAKLDPKQHNLVLINPRSYFIHYPGCIRMLVTSDGQLEDRVLIPYTNNFHNGNGAVLTDTVTGIEDKGNNQGGTITLKSGQTISFAILVLATGSLWPGPLVMPVTKEETILWVSQWREKFERSQDVVLIGGGACAIEISGELKDYWPDKHVTIVQGAPHLLNDTYPLRYRLYIEKRLRSLGVDLIFDDYIDDAVTRPDGTIITRKKKVITADLVVPVYGNRPNTDFIRSFDPDALTPQGYVKIQPTLQLLSHPSIYAAGDIMDWKEQKQVGKCYTHAEIVTANIVETLAGKPASIRYKGAYELIVITMGRARGASYFGVLWGLVFGDWVSTLIKSRNLLIEMTRKRLGFKS